MFQDCDWASNPYSYTPHIAVTAAPVLSIGPPFIVYFILASYGRFKHCCNYRDYSHHVKSKVPVLREFLHERSQII